MQIQNLIKAKDDATERYEKLVLDFSHLQTTPQEISILNRRVDYRSSTYQSNAYIPQPGLATVRLTASANTIIPDVNHAAHSPDYNALLLQLDMCSSALWRLTSAINTASWNLRMARTYEPKGISESYHDLQIAVEALLAMEGNNAQSEKATLPRPNYAYTPHPPFYSPQAAAQVLQRTSAPVQPPSNALKPYQILEEEGEALDGQDIEENTLNKAGEMTEGVEEEMELPGLVTDASQLVGKELSEAAEGVEEGVLKGIEFREEDVRDMNDMPWKPLDFSAWNPQLSPGYLRAVDRTMMDAYSPATRQPPMTSPEQPDQQFTPPKKGRESPVPQAIFAHQHSRKPSYGGMTEGVQTYEQSRIGSRAGSETNQYNQHSRHSSPGRQRSNTTQYRPDPRTNKDGKYICTVSTDCAGQTFDRKCEWK